MGTICIFTNDCRSVPGKAFIQFPHGSLFISGCIYLCWYLYTVAEVSYGTEYCYWRRSAGSAVVLSGSAAIGVRNDPGAIVMAALLFSRGLQCISGA